VWSSRTNVNDNVFKVALDLEQIFTESANFTIILYTLPLSPERLQAIENYSRQHAIPAIAIHSVGFYSYFRIALPGVFPIVDTHPDETATTDLRLLDPWAELTDFTMEMTNDIENLSAHDHGHLPMVAILLHFLEVWKQQNGGSYPTKYQDKIAFRDLVSAGMRKDNPEGGEENFEEAIAAVMKHVVVPSLPSSLRQVFEYQHKDGVGSPVVASHQSIDNLTSTPGTYQVQLLAYCRRRQGILREEPATACSWRPTRHESPIQHIHQTTKHLQGQGPPRRQRGSSHGPQQAWWRRYRSS
jgi:hypothetical protein